MHELESGKDKASRNISVPMSGSPEIFLPDDQIVNVQGSMGDVEKLQEEVTNEDDQATKGDDQSVNEDASHIGAEDQQQERRSDRLKKEITMTTLRKD